MLIENEEFLLEESSQENVCKHGCVGKPIIDTWSGRLKESDILMVFNENGKHKHSPWSLRSFSTLSQLFLEKYELFFFYHTRYRKLRLCLNILTIPKVVINSKTKLAGNSNFIFFRKYSNFN